MIVLRHFLNRKIKNASKSLAFAGIKYINYYFDCRKQRI